MRIEIRHTYDSKLSKNEHHDFIPIGKKNQWDGLSGVPVEPQKVRMVVNKASATALMAGIERVARGECTRVRQKTGEEFKPHKIYVDIMVYRPDMRTDPVNFVDMICDAVKRGIGIDDNIYAGSWDWELVDPPGEIVITVRQEIADGRNKCDGQFPVADARWELLIVGGELEECRAKLADLVAKEKRILLSLGEEATGGGKWWQVEDIIWEIIKTNIQNSELRIKAIRECGWREGEETLEDILKIAELDGAREAYQTLDNLLAGREADDDGGVA